MTTATLSTKGIAKFLDVVADIEGKIPEAVDAALLAGAEVVQKQMQALAPVDTGNLRDHIRIKGPTHDGSYISIEVGVLQDIDYTDAATARYGKVMEYGSSSVKPRSYIRAGELKSQAAWRRKLIEILKANTGMDFK